jgi:hypothetical protein
MGPRKNESSYWGYEEQGNGQLQSVQSFQRNTNTRALVILKTERKAQMKQAKQNWVGSKFFLVKQKIIWLSTVFWWKESFFGLTIADAVRLTYQLVVRNGIKNQFCKRSGWKISYVVIQKFQLEPLKVFHS